MLNTNSLADKQVSEAVNAWVMIKSCKIAQAKNLNEYLSWEGLDINATKTFGTFYAPAGQPIPMFNQGDVCAVSGTIGQGVNNKAVWAKTMVRVLDPQDIAEFEQLCYPSVPADQLKQVCLDLELLADSFTDPQLLLFSQKLFEYFKPYLQTIPAAKTIHEACRGGLALHTWYVVKMCEQVLDIQPNMNSDVLLFSALYHDLGKTQEYTAQLGYSPNGRLITHSSIAIQLFTDTIIKNNIRLDMKMFRQIKHCLVSHHGEFAEIRPATKEALALHYCDMLCAKLGYMEEIIKGGTVGLDGWAPFSHIINTSPYVPSLDTRE